jgi:hypothetical protein
MLIPLTKLSLSPQRILSGWCFLFAAWLSVWISLLCKGGLFLFLVAACILPWYAIYEDTSSVSMTTSRYNFWYILVREHQCNNCETYNNVTESCSINSCDTDSSRSIRYWEDSDGRGVQAIFGVTWVLVGLGTIISGFNTVQNGFRLSFVSPILSVLSFLVFFFIPLAFPDDTCMDDIGPCKSFFGWTRSTEMAWGPSFAWCSLVLAFGYITSILVIGYKPLYVPRNQPKLEEVGLLENDAKESLLNFSTPKSP